MKRTLIAVSAVAGVVLLACPFDATLREYLSARFWLPFSKSGAHFLKKNVRRTTIRYAGISSDTAVGTLANLQRAYTQVASIEVDPIPADDLAKLVAAARADRGLTAQQREEVELIDAKIAMRLAQLDRTGKTLAAARAKFEAFLRTARNSAYQSEARGWLARVLFLQGDQTAAGKIYLDELNRNGSNISNETLLNSLRIVYGYDGGSKLREHLADYFDTPEHAAFAIQLATNPRWHNRERPALRWWGDDTDLALEPTAKTYVRIRELLNQHADLLRRNPDENSLPMLALRTALRMGDVAGAAKIADEVPSASSLRSHPDFLWTIASVRFLSHNYSAAEEPLLALFNLKSAEEAKHAAAAYGLCGVYQKLRRPVEQLQYALWLHELSPTGGLSTGLADMSIYNAYSGWDLNLLLEFEAPIEALRTFVEQNPKLRGIDRVRYAMAVRLGREQRYEEAAALYRALGANGRAARMRRLAELTRAAESKPNDYEARFRLADYINSNSEALYFNDQIWKGYQRYVFQGATEGRMTRVERERLVAGERKLKDDQEEHWRAYLILRGIVNDAGPTPVGRKSALLAINCLRSLSDRFGREEEIRRSDMELTQWLRR